MRRYSYRFYGLLVFVPLILVSACKKESIEPEIPEKKDRWELTDAATMNISPTVPFEIQFDASDELYAIQRYSGSSYTMCNCKTESGTWKRFPIDSLSSNVTLTFLTRVSDDGYVWVLTDTRLIKLNSCGSFESYTVASSDSLSFNEFYNRFVGLEVVNGIPWLLHATWGLYRYDLAANSLVHHPVLYPFPFYTDLSEIGYFLSLAVDNTGNALFNNTEGRVWVGRTTQGTQPLEYIPCYDCLFHNFRTSPTGEVYAQITKPDGDTRTRNIVTFSPQQTLPLNESPNYFTKSVFDRNGQLAYYSGYPNFQPYIGLQPNGAPENIVNARHVVEEGNVTVYHLGFNAANELFVATDQGILKYLGRDE